MYVIKNGRLDYREVHVAFRETDHVFVDSGIANGDTLVVELLQGVAPGQFAEAKIEGDAS